MHSLILRLTQDSSKLISRNRRQQHIRTLPELAMILLTVIGDKTLHITWTDVTNGHYSMVLIPTTSDMPQVFVCLCYHWLQFPKAHVLPPLGSIFTLLLSMIRSILFIPQLGIIICISTATTFTYIIKGKTAEFVSFISRYADVSGAITIKLECEGERRNEAAGRSDAWGCGGWPAYLIFHICYYSHDNLVYYNVSKFIWAIMILNYCSFLVLFR